MSVRFHHWRLGFRQSSFHHIARVLQGTILHAFRWPLLLRHALVPSGFRLQVNRMTQKPPFELLLTASGIQHRVPRRTLSHHPALQRKRKYFDTTTPFPNGATVASRDTPLSMPPVATGAASSFLRPPYHWMWRWGLVPEGATYASLVDHRIGAVSHDRSLSHRV